MSFLKEPYRMIHIRPVKIKPKHLERVRAYIVIRPILMINPSQVNQPVINQRIQKLTMTKPKKAKIQNLPLPTRKLIRLNLETVLTNLRRYQKGTNCPMKTLNV